MCSYIYAPFFYEISAWVFLIHMFLYAGFYCIFKAFTKRTSFLTMTILFPVDKEFTVFLTITDKVFTGNLKDIESLEFLNLAEKLQVAVCIAYNCSFQNGSILIFFCLHSNYCFDF